MDSQDSHSHQASIQYCIPGIEIPEISQSGFIITKNNVQGKVCYTLTVGNVPTREDVGGIARNTIGKDSFIQLGTKTIIQEIRKYIPTITRSDLQELEGILSDSYDETKLLAYVSKLELQYGASMSGLEEKVRRYKDILGGEYRLLLKEYRDDLSQLFDKQKGEFTPDLALLLIQKMGGGKIDTTVQSIGGVYDTIVRLNTDPKYKRIVYQDALSVLFQTIERYAGVHLKIVSTGGKDRADGALAVKMPTGDGNFPRVMILSKGYTLGASSLEEGLDALAVAENRPVFSRYFITTHGDIEVRFRTPLSDWTESMLFPSNQELHDWIYNPALIPQNAEVSVYSNSHGKRVSITKMTPKGWFLKLGIKEEEFMTIRGSTEYFTLGYSNNKGALQGNIALTGSKVAFRGIDRSKDTSDTGISVTGNWEGKMNLDPKNQGPCDNLNFLSRGHFVLGVQIGNRSDIDYTQTASIGIKTTHFLECAITPQLIGEIGVGYDRRWSPNISPNTFGVLTSKERRLTHFEKDPILTGSLRYRGSIGEIEGKYSQTTGKLINYIRTSLSYTLGKTMIRIEENRQDSHHPLISDRHEQGASITSNQGNIRAFGTAWSRKMGGKSDRFYEVGITSSF